MNFDEKTKIDKFEDFYEWLKSDGLKPKKSERLHKKKIFSGLLANDEMTLENFKDFMEIDLKNQIQDLKGKKINYQNQEYLINEVKIEEEEFYLISENLNLKVKFLDFENLKKLMKD